MGDFERPKIDLIIEDLKLKMKIKVNAMEMYFLFLKISEINPQMHYSVDINIKISLKKFVFSVDYSS